MITKPPTCDSPVSRTFLENLDKPDDEVLLRDIYEAYFEINVMVEKQCPDWVLTGSDFSFREH